MKQLLLFLILLLNGCIIKKEVSVYVNDSARAKLNITVTGSDLEDIKPELSLPLP